MNRTAAGEDENMELYNEKELDRLNPYQKEAVLDESPACIVNANVGSGKTTVLISKVQYLCLLYTSRCV